MVHTWIQDLFPRWDAGFHRLLGHDLQFHADVSNRICRVAQILDVRHRLWCPSHMHQNYRHI